MVHNSSVQTNYTKVTCNIYGLVQERRNSIANALELRLSCTNPTISNEACRFTAMALAAPVPSHAVNLP